MSSLNPFPKATKEEIIDKNKNKPKLFNNFHKLKKENTKANINNKITHHHNS